MKPFDVSVLPQSSVLFLYQTRDEIQIDPEYQRMGEVWTLDKRQLLIDSILNGFDIPKIYFHELSSQFANKKHRYAIVDGRQRLESIWKFVDGEYPLSEEFDYLKDPSVKAAGLSYGELAKKYPRLKGIFDATSLTVISVRTEDLDLIEEMFSRLNEAVPLNAAEKRNALGGPMPIAIRRVAGFRFFKSRLSISNRRYQHRDLAAKFLHLVHTGKVADTKKVYLDAFVKNFRGAPANKVSPVVKRVRKVVKQMEGVFVRQDRLLRSAGMVVLYFLLFKDGIGEGWVDRITRSRLDGFERARAQNRKTAEKTIAKANYELLEFDRLTQTPNDSYALELRLKTIKKFILKKAGQ